MKICYGYDQPVVDRGLSGNYYAAIFGAATSASENLIIQKKIMGPCWLRFQNVTVHPEGSAKVKVTTPTRKKHHKLMSNLSFIFGKVLPHPIRQRIHSREQTTANSVLEKLVCL